MAPDCCENIVEQSMTSARPNFGEPHRARSEIDGSMACSHSFDEEQRSQRSMFPRLESRTR
jgi:hypothetical protein